MRKVDSVYSDEQTKECRSESLENQVVMAGISGRFNSLTRCEAMFRQQPFPHTTNSTNSTAFIDLHSHPA
jgi:hypothetical protein